MEELALKCFFIIIIGCTSAVWINERFPVGCLLLAKPSVLLNFKAYVGSGGEVMFRACPRRDHLESDPVVKINVALTRVFMSLTVIQLISLSSKA